MSIVITEYKLQSVLFWIKQVFVGYHRICFLRKIYPKFQKLNMHMT